MFVIVIIVMIMHLVWVLLLDNVQSAAFAPRHHVSVYWLLLFGNTCLVP